MLQVSATGADSCFVTSTKAFVLVAKCLSFNILPMIVLTFANLVFYNFLADILTSFCLAPWAHTW